MPKELPVVGANDAAWVTDQQRWAKGWRRVVFPYIFFVGSAALGMAALNAKRRFAVAAFAPGLLNVALLAAALGLPGILIAAGRDPVLALDSASLPHTANIGAVDPTLNLDVITDHPRPLAPGKDLALSNSLAFGGLNAVLAFRRFTP